ncbi:hypothetical protein GCM10018783_18200 [Streptomyces griseosporeus]|nr:hypothetical protein GCM10018783_18200 [Streptomyces griseosporeus]
MRDVETVPREDRGQGRGDMVVVLDEQQSHPGLLRFTVRTCSLCSHASTRACTMAVTLMDDDAVKRVPGARDFSYPADTSAGHKCYDTCPIAIGS